MLSIALIGSHQERYYTSLAAEDYYQDGGEPPGAWVGVGAERLGLTGQVETEDLRSLMQGFAPDGGSLARNAGRPSRRAGFDLTFNAEKSVSVLFALADAPIRDAVRAAHAAAVRAALVYLEDAAGSVRRGVDGVDSERAGLVVATYEHSTARLVPGADVPDPHLHTHCVVMNVGVTPDGRSATLDSTLLFKHKMAAGALYRAELVRQLVERLGLEVERRGRYAALTAIPESICKHFSKRRAAIEGELVARGASGARAAERATLATRSTKPRVERERFLEAWQQSARDLGFEGQALLVRLSAPDASSRPKGPRQASEVATDAAHTLTETRAHFAARDLVQATAEALEGEGYGARAIRAAVAATLQGRDLVPLGELGREARYTTRAMLAVERGLLSQADELRQRGQRLRASTLRGVLAARPTISPEQRAALVDLARGQSLALVRGLAGTGKTFLLDALRDAHEREGRVVIGACLAAAAAQRLEAGSGIASQTLHRLLHGIERGTAMLDERTVIVLDEAAMVGTRQLAELVRHVHAAGSTLVLVGDDRQLQAIDAGAPFAALVRRHGVSELRVIQRQREEWAREAVLAFSRGDARSAVERFEERGLLGRYATRSDALEALARDYLACCATSCGAAEVLALTGTRADAARVNRLVQAQRLACGELGAHLELEGERYYVGDRVLFRRNARKLGVLNGDRGAVVDVSAHGLTVRLDRAGQRVTVHPSAVAGARPMLGYASTTHAAQGATVEHTLVLLGGPLQDREATYVQASRARGSTRFYVDELSAGEGLDDVLRAMERSRAKDLAHDVLEQGGGGRVLSVAA